MAEVQAAVTGIIPARAGFTDLTAGEPASPEDHPRSRGVYPALMSRCATARGSSSLARGLLTGESGTLVMTRIIPARAGFTKR